MNRAAVITVSDSAHSGTREDVSGPSVKARLEQLGWQVDDVRTVPDEPSQLSDLLTKLADGAQVCAIFTTGGTGLGPRPRSRPTGG